MIEKKIKQPIICSLFARKEKIKASITTALYAIIIIYILFLSIIYYNHNLYLIFKYYRVHTAVTLLLNG